MSIIRQVAFAIAKRVATNPRVQRRAGQLAVRVDRKMNTAADKTAEIVMADDPAREAGRLVGRLLRGRDEGKR